MHPWQQILLHHYLESDSPFKPTNRMPQCCRCNDSGCCVSCVCARNGKTCTNCTPGRNGRCENRSAPQPELPPSAQLPPDNVPTTTENNAVQPSPSETLRGLQSLVETNFTRSDNHGSGPDDDFDGDGRQTNGELEGPQLYTLLPPDFLLGEKTGEVFSQLVSSAYEKVVHWRHNIFLIPSGKAGKAFVRELARLYQAYADASALECIALKACSVLQCLLLQKLHAKSKFKDYFTHLE